MNQEKITSLRKQYPPEDFDIKESQGSLIVSPKKGIIRIFAKQLSKSMAKVQEHGAEAVKIGRAHV